MVAAYRKTSSCEAGFLTSDGAVPLWAVLGGSVAERNPRPGFVDCCFQPDLAQGRVILCTMWLRVSE